MGTEESETPVAPAFSIIVAAYNDWTALGECLRSLREQTDSPPFEIVLVDDGSDDLVPESFAKQTQNLPLRIVRQPHEGVAAARNTGIALSRGSILLFIDADSRLKKNCLAALDTIAGTATGHDYFQLSLAGDCATLAGRSEDLRLTMLQDHLRTSDRIRYLNTAGFALRRSQVDMRVGLFDCDVVRGEDTLLLAELMERGILPFFASTAVVQHQIPAGWAACLKKDIRAAYLERWTYRRLSFRGLQIRVSHQERLSMLRRSWLLSAKNSIGRDAWSFMLCRQLLSRLISLGYSTPPTRPALR
jgi:glycosyltransferase involved in cell wall biosynthesis